MKVWQVIVIGVAVHLIFFYSIFDIYFTSPLVHGMTPYSSRNLPPARRLVLFVADGLRADKFFELDDFGRSRAPFLRNIIEEQGAWGISHTRMPTESRPGHVALIAGFYEDVSAVAKGWKENPVQFDSVFNESRFTWSWGSPDILPMFAKGATGSHVMVHCYPAHFEDFASADNTHLDLWVFNAFKKFFESAKGNETLKNILQEDKLVFFLHLLGIDTNGHSNKPYSQEYLTNIRVVDDGIRQVEKMMEVFYNRDGKTAYVMTSDHGMTDWGSHGAGHPHETLTPLVAWGAGLRQPQPTDGSCGDFPDDFCNDWHLQHRKRTDVFQADIAPLMAFLVGLPFPVNSVGVLPVDYLNGTDAEKAEGLFANAQQILAQYQVKMSQVKDRSISATFRPFKDLLLSAEVDVMRNVNQLIKNGHYQDAISESKFIIETALKGLRYYQTYDRFFLGFSITLGFIGWMGYVLYLVVAEHTSLVQSVPATAYGRKQFCICVTFGIVGLIVSLLLLVQSLPWTNYFYCLLPVILWMKLAQGWVVICSSLQQALSQSCLVSIAAAIIFSLLGLEMIVLCFFYRQLVSLGLVAMAAWAVSTPVWKTYPMICMSWICSCLVVAIFPLLPVVSRNSNYYLVLASGLAALVTGGIMIWRICSSNYSCVVDTMTKRVLCFQLLLIALATVIVKVTSDRIADKSGSPAFTRLLSWTILFISPCLSLLIDVGIQVRLFSLFLAFLAPYLLMSITYEGLFLLSLMCVLHCWLRLEACLTQIDTKQASIMSSFNPSTMVLDKKDIQLSTRHLQLTDLRRVYFFIFLILTAFFGTGNIASINSFDPASVYCFLTVFNPFVMGALMMLKVVLPFVVVTCVMKAIQVITGVSLRAVMLLILLMSDVMGLNFFFLVKDYGSWLDIGTSISHYVICMSMITFVTVLMGLSQVLTSFTFARKM